jgi:thymidylate synthase
MIVIKARNVSEALGIASLEFMDSKTTRLIAPRDGKQTLELKEPLTTVYRKPVERVLFHRERDANPFFHFMESLWIMAGRQDVAWIKQFNSTIDQFSDDGVVFNAPYGFRMRNHFGVDQFKFVIEHLRSNPDSRRAVISLWDPRYDTKDSKDIPCNDLIMFKVRDSRLNMTVMNRSNDMIWGAYGANAVQFSMIQEFVAAAIGVKMGEYRQVSDSFHVYLDNPKWEGIKKSAHELLSINPYEVYDMDPMKMVNTDADTWFKDLQGFMVLAAGEASVMALDDPFFAKLAVPLLNAWNMRKNFKDSKEGAREAIQYLHSERLQHNDWGLAAIQWLERRSI